MTWEARRKKAETLIGKLTLGRGCAAPRAMRLSGGEQAGAWRLHAASAIDPAFILAGRACFPAIDPIAVLELQQIIFDLKASGIGVH